MQHITKRCEGEKIECKNGIKKVAYNQAGLGRAFTVIDGSFRNALVDFEDGRG